MEMYFKNNSLTCPHLLTELMLNIHWKKTDSLVFLSGKCAHYLQYLYLIYNSTGFHVSSEVLTSLPSHYCTNTGCDFIIIL